jgi:uncharacterized PurR-regulated membrane protein YhhQ (DUF165 family)
LGVGIAELKSGSRWAPGVGFSPDVTGYRAPVATRPRNHLAAEAAYVLAVSSPLILAIAILTALLGAIYVFSDTMIAGLGDRLRIADLLVPPGFFLIQLTSRRYGAGRALLQLLGALALCGVAVLAASSAPSAWLASLPMVAPRNAVAFALAFALANCAGIAFFEAARGPSWWKAPFFGAMAAVLVFCATFYPLLDENWAAATVLHMAQQGLEAGLLLIPYWLLRGAIRPLPGLNGY